MKYTTKVNQNKNRLVGKAIENQSDRKAVVEESKEEVKEEIKEIEVEEVKEDKGTETGSFQKLVDAVKGVTGSKE